MYAAIVHPRASQASCCAGYEADEGHKLRKWSCQSTSLCGGGRRVQSLFWQRAPPSAHAQGPVGPEIACSLNGHADRPRFVSVSVQISTRIPLSIPKIHKDGLALHARSAPLSKPAHVNNGTQHKVILLAITRVVSNEFNNLVQKAPTKRSYKPMNES